MRRFLFLSLISIAFVAGCGGGGGGGGPEAPSPEPTPTPGPLQPPRELLFEDFSGGALNGARWGIYSQDQTLQRTGFGSAPTFGADQNGTNYARLALQTYNPDNPNTFRGTEIFTRQRFPRGNGLEISARLRGPITQPGVVFAFFGIYDRFEGRPSAQTYRKTEIDFEFLTAEKERFSPVGQSRRLYLNVWDDWNEPRDGYDGDDVETPTRLRDDKTYGTTNQAGFTWTQWNTYTIRWYPNRVEFYLNGGLQRTERQVRPNEDLSVHFNIWSSEAPFAQAYSPNFKPTTDESQNSTFYMDVDYLRVRQLAPSPAQTLLQTEILPVVAGVKR